MMRLALLTLILTFCAGRLPAQNVSTTQQDDWAAYDAFNKVYLDSTKYIYKDFISRESAVDRWNGAAAIWCQAHFYEMALAACERAKKEGDAKRYSQACKHVLRLMQGNIRQYADFNFDDCNINTGWFVYDDIMWWTIALAKTWQAFGDERSLALAEESFCRVYYGSEKVGDDGSYADPKRGLGGGMFWEWQPIDKPKPHKPGDFRSACINFPTVIAACLLSRMVPESQTVADTETHPKAQSRAFYLRTAREVYKWADETLVENGRVADGIHNAGPEFNDHLYNQATYIGASCLLYQLTGERDYLRKAVEGANYVFEKMCKDGILPLETGPEQGVYCAIFAQYMRMLVYDCGQRQYLTYIRQNIEAGWKNRDRKNGLSDGRFAHPSAINGKTEVYPASGLPALMLMFPSE